MRHFTNKEINELLTARIKGKTHIEIAASLGRTPKSVRAKMYAMNKLAPLPTTLEELAENFDVWTQKKTTSLPKKSLRFTDNPVLAEILDGWDEADEPAKKATVQAFKDPNLTDEEVVEVFKKPVRAKPKYYLRHVTFETKEQAKAMGALWDDMCWFIPDTVTGEAREKLISHYGPVCYGNHSKKGKGQWETFTYADNASPNATTNSRGNIAPPVQAAKTKAKTKPVKEKEATQKPRTNPNVTTAVDTHSYFVIRVPKIYVWVVITASLMAAAWYVGKTY